MRTYCIAEGRLNALGGPAWEEAQEGGDVCIYYG